MSINQLCLILYDTYYMDAQMPPLFGKWLAKFKKTSYSRWAIDELVEFIADGIYPKEKGDIDEFITLTRKFMKRMNYYSKVNPETSQIFQSAAEMSINVLDLLQAMK